MLKSWQLYCVLITNSLVVIKASKRDNRLKWVRNLKEAYEIPLAKAKAETIEVTQDNLKKGKLKKK